MTKEAPGPGGEEKQREGKVEKASRFLRNINVLGALALGGAALIAPPLAAVPLGVLAGIDIAQAGGFEAARQVAKKRRLRKQKSAGGDK